MAKSQTKTRTKTKTKRPSGGLFRKGATKDLIILFSIPTGVFLLALSIAFIPRLTANPQHDFIYEICHGYCRSHPEFAVDSYGKVVQSDKKPEDISDIDYDDRFEVGEGRYVLYYYNVKEDSFRSISLDEAQKYQLNSNSISPDGYVLNRNDPRDVSVFIGSDYNRLWRLEKGIAKRPIYLTSERNSYYSSDSVKFLGWVK